MASVDSNNIPECTNNLSLTEDEKTLPPWQQMLCNGAISPRNITVCSDSDDSSEEESPESEQQYFSDEENTEQGIKHTVALELREYQKELAENALQGKNTIICAPTGSGKTRVATYIIAEHLKARGKGQKVVFFARTVPLAYQQYKSLCKYLPSYEITHITGDSKNNERLHFLLPYYDIFVLTPMILENHLDRKYLSHLGMFSLLVFDECHHTRKGEPYNTLMGYYHKMKHEISKAARNGRELNMKLPQIVGLTASIGIEGAGNIEYATSKVLEVCGNLNVSTMSTVEKNKNELCGIVPVPIDKYVSLSERKDDVSVNKIYHIMQELETKMMVHIRELNNDNVTRWAYAKPDDRKSQEYEQWAVQMTNVAKAVPIDDRNPQADVSVRMIIKIAQFLVGYRFALETYDLVELRDVMDFLDRNFQALQVHEHRSDEENELYIYFLELRVLILSTVEEKKNPNLQILADTLMQYLITKGADTRGIVFVKTRALAESLASWLNRCENQDLRNLNSCIFTGSNVPEALGGTSQARQEDIMKRFLSGEIRLIVATSVAEEGIDIPKCNLVVKYNHVGNEVTTVQTRGRSRSEGGVSVLLATESVLQRERANRSRAELMLRAIENIRAMRNADFEAAVGAYQEQLYQSTLLTEQREVARKQSLKNIPFRIVCPMCRKVSISGSNVKTIYGKYRVSIDRDLLDQIKLYPRAEPEPMDGMFFLATAVCMGEPQPGKKCLHQLGFMIKNKGIPFLAVGIKNIVFQTDAQSDLKPYKQWKKVPYWIDELSNEDISRYLTETSALFRAGNNVNAEETEEESDSSDD